MNRSRDLYGSINHHKFGNALINLLETEYKILGSRKILSMLAEDIEMLYKEYHPLVSQVSFG